MTKQAIFAGLEGKKALVTGASRNIGQGIALRLAEAGCDLTVAAQANREGLDQTVERAREFGVNATGVLADLATAQGCADLLAEAAATMGQVDALVHTVAIRPHQPFETLEFEQWEHVRSLVLDSAMHLCLGTLPGMGARGFGRVVLFTGIGSYRGSAHRAHISAAKLGLVGLARGLAREYAARNVRVNVLSPGTIDTERANPEWYGNNPPSAKGIPMDRRGTVAEVADSTIFLLSDAAGFVTGQTLHVNGGEAFYG
ncbi:MAG: SDR family oxidoreductase [Pseudomonadota bacterium]